MLELQARFREFRRTPGYVLAVLFSLSTGMAVCLAVFSIVNTLVFAEVSGISDRTTVLRLTWSDGRPLSPADFEPFTSDPPPSLGPAAAEGDRDVGVVLPSGAALLPAAFVSQDFFATLGTRPLLGRLLTAADADTASAPVLAISETLWQSAFGGQPEAIGRTLVVAGRAFTIVGVAPRGFPGLAAADVGTQDSQLPQIFMPLRFVAMWPGAGARAARFLAVAARLKPGARLASARQQVAAIGSRLTEPPGGGGQARSLRAFRMGLNLWDETSESALVIVLYLFIPLGILGIGCGNVVNLQLARAVEHASELSVLLALGASGRRIAWLLTIEVVPMAIIAAALGWAGARELLTLVQAFVPVHFALDARAVVFAAGIVVFSTSIAGAWPGWLASRDVVGAGLRARLGTPARTRTRHVLVIAQVTASVALMALTVLAAHTLQARTPDVPHDARSTLVADINLRAANPQDVRTILDALSAEPTVQSAGFADFSFDGRPIRYRYATDHEGPPRTAYGGVTSPGWFDATHTSVLAGRIPGPSGDHVFEAVVNAEFADRAGRNPTNVLGSRLRVGLPGGEQTVEIVGVIADGPPVADGRPVPTLILPMSSAAISPTTLVLSVHATDLDAAKIAITRAVKQFDPSIPFVRIETLDARLTEQSQGFRDITAFAAALAAIALLLTSTGLYALTSYTVRRRTPELAIRIAMGARPAQILALVARLTATLVLIGGVLGLAVATPIAVVMRSAFFGLSPWSPWAGLPTMALLLLVAGIATAVPAYRAIRVDPAVALREA
jgi:predicted permease